MVPDSDTAVTCPMVQTHLVQCQGGVFLSQRSCQFLQVLRLLHVILQRFVEADILLEHGARGIIQLPKRFQQKGLGNPNTPVCLDFKPDV